MKKLLTLLIALTLVGLSAFALAEDDPAAEPGETAESAQTLELDRNTMTGTTEVSLTVDRSMDSYTVVIPSKVTIDPKTQYGYGDVVLKSGWELVASNNLQVRLMGAENGINSGRAYGLKQSADFSNISSSTSYLNFQLKNDDNKTVSYAIKSNKHAYPFTAGNDTERTESIGNYMGTASYYYYFGTNYRNSLISVKKGDSNSSNNTCQLTFYINKMPNDPGVYTDTLTFSIITQ